MSLNETLRDVQRLVWISCFAAFIAVSALFPIPIGPVPMTLQTMFVLLAGLVLGSRYGTIAVLLYMGAGFIGLPIFAGGRSGITVLWGPTGGYLITFLVMAYLAGIYHHAKKFSFLLCLTLCLAASLINLFVGALWLSWSMDYSLVVAMSSGVLTFIPGAVIKAIAAVSIYSYMRKYGLLTR